MRQGNGTSQRICKAGVDPAALSQTIEGRIFVEAVHLDGPFDGVPGSCNGQSSVRLAGDGDDAAINRRCKRLIDSELRLAGCFALVEGRIVEKGKSDGPFDLYRAIPGQENGGGVRIDPSDVDCSER